jgi:hypothetical protein
MVTGPATITFWWKVNCDSFWNSLAFGVNGTIQNAITGTADWQQASHYIGSGLQSLTWSLYPVHQAYAGGTGWLDQVQVIPGGTGAIITTTSSGILTNAGNNVSFSVSATGTPPLKFQWSYEGTNLVSATNATITLNNVQTQNAGHYTVVVTNVFGSSFSSNITLVVDPSAPVITTQPGNKAAVFNGSATFAVAAKGSSPFQYQWRFNGVEIAGETNNMISLSNLQSIDAGNYSVIVTNDYGSAISSSALLEVSPTAILEFWPMFTQSYATPSGLSNVVAIASGTMHTVGLRDNGTIISWGRNTYGQTSVPAGLSNVTAISAGFDHTVALKSDGSVVAWGDNTYGQSVVPECLSNVIAVASSGNDTFALTKDGTVIGWGNNANEQLNIPAGLSNVVGIAAGTFNGFAIKEDGSVVQWGNGPVWQSNGTNAQLSVAKGMSNITAVVAGGMSAWSLLDDGTVQSWGTGDPAWYDRFAVISAAGSSSPTFSDYSLLLKNDGSVIKSGNRSATPDVPINLSNVVAIAAGNGHAAILVSDGTPRMVRPLLNRTAHIGARVEWRAGLVGASPMFYQWQFNGTNLDGATNVLLTMTNVSLYSSGNYGCIASNSFGSATNTAATLKVIRSTPLFKGMLIFSSKGYLSQLSQLSGHGNTVIMASTNLVDWVPVFTNSPVTGSLIYLDPEATNLPSRFYRAFEN